MMGDAESSYASMKPVHEVTLSHDFYMTKYEITNAQYAAFLNATELEKTVRDRFPIPTERAMSRQKNRCWLR